MGSGKVAICNRRLLSAFKRQGLSDQVGNQQDRAGLLSCRGVSNHAARRYRHRSKMVEKAPPPKRSALANELSQLIRRRRTVAVEQAMQAIV